MSQRILEPLAIGVDTYCYHRLFGELRPVERRSPVSFDHDDLLGEIVDSGAEVASLQTCYLPRYDSGFLSETRAVLAAGGVEIALSWGHPSGLAGGTDPSADADLTRLVYAAWQSGIELVRIVVGGPSQWCSEPEGDVVRRLVSQLRRHVDRAETLGVRLAVETHCELSLPSFAAVVEAFDGSLGVVLDTGNVVRIGAAVDDAVSRLGEFTLMVHAKDLSFRDAPDPPQPRGAWWCMPVGRGRLPVLAVLDDLVAKGFSGPVCVEIMELDPAYSGDERDAVRDSLHTLRTWRSDRLPSASGAVGVSDRATYVEDRDSNDRPPTSDSRFEDG